jgi:ketol-acid reductoisomerase
MADIRYDKDVDPKALAGATIAVIGYGSQGHAHALNLRDSGHDVIVGLAAGSKSRARAEGDGLEVREVADAARNADVVALLVPDQHHKSVYESAIKPFMGPGRTLVVAHAFSVHFKQVTPVPGADVVLVAPKAPGHRMRELYVEGRGVPALFAVAQDGSGHAEKTALAYAKAVGCARAGAIRTTFSEEVETDLFGEQAVLCGGISELIKSGFQTLVDAGYQPEVAYFECMHEMKLIVDLMYEGGLSYMRYSVSDTAEFGDYTSGPRVIDDRVKATMKQVLTEIRDGTFAKKWIAEYEKGAPNLLATRKREQAQLIEQVGRKLRSMMPWLPKKDWAALGIGASEQAASEIGLRSSSERTDDARGEAASQNKVPA